MTLSLKPILYLFWSFMSLVFLSEFEKQVTTYHNAGHGGKDDKEQNILHCHFPFTTDDDESVPRREPKAPLNAFAHGLTVWQTAMNHRTRKPTATPTSHGVTVSNIF